VKAARSHDFHTSPIKHFSFSSRAVTSLLSADPRAKKPLNDVAAWIGKMTFERDATFSARVGSERHAGRDVRTNP
jgi:hypothetical protein